MRKKTAGMFISGKYAKISVFSSQKGASVDQEKVEQLWDKLFKIVGDYFPEDIVEFIMPKEKIKLCGKFEQERIVLEYQVADINLWIMDDGKKKLLNIEPYSTWTHAGAAEVFTRNGIITKSLSYKHEVVSVAVVLDKKTYIGMYQTKLHDKTINEFRFPVVSLDKAHEILKKCPPLAPFLLKIDLAYKDKVLQVIKDHKVLKYVTVLILNRLGYSQEEALRMAGVKHDEFKQALLDVPIMQDISKELIFEAKLEIARNLLADGIDVKIIAKSMGLKVEEIEKLKS